VECTANDVSFFKHHRHVEQRNGERAFKLAPLRKSIYSLGDLRRLMHAANDRYLAFMACLDNPDAAQNALARKDRRSNGCFPDTEEEVKRDLGEERGEERGPNPVGTWGKTVFEAVR
jgi:hypothetical protein